MQYIQRAAKRLMFNVALKDQLFKKTITCNRTLHVQFIVRAERFAYVPACAHVSLFFTVQNKEVQKIGHTSEVLNVWAYNNIGQAIYVDLNLRQFWFKIFLIYFFVVSL